MIDLWRPISGLPRAHSVELTKLVIALCQNSDQPHRCVECYGINTATPVGCSDQTAKNTINTAQPALLKA